MIEVKVGKKYDNKGRGYYEVVEYVNYDKIKIRFKDTGFEKWVETSQIRKCCITDPYYPSNFGIGFIGEGKYTSRNTPAYDFWRSILKKVDSDNGVTLEVSWYNFQKFAEWYEYNYKGGDYITSTDKRLYGPKTCIFEYYNQYPKVGKSYESNNYGEYIILRSSVKEGVHIKFLKTGYELTTTLNAALAGNVRDPYYPSVKSVGYFGVGREKASINGKMTKSYQTWVDMLKRCYDPYFLNKNKTYINCFVCEDWHNFQVFSVWYNVHRIENYDLDKDIKQKDFPFKIYSPNTCKFVPEADNTEEANAKHYHFLSPEGVYVHIYNMSKFCRLNNLDSGAMGKVYRGKASHHKGWKIPHNIEREEV